MWNNELNDLPPAQKSSTKAKLARATFTQTQIYLKPLFRKLKSKKLPEDILDSLTIIIRHLLDRNYIMVSAFPWISISVNFWGQSWGFTRDFVLYRPATRISKWLSVTPRGLSVWLWWVSTLEQDEKRSSPRMWLTCSTTKPKGSTFRRWRGSWPSANSFSLPTRQDASNIANRFERHFKFVGIIS